MARDARKVKYNEHKQNAKRRGIAFRLSFDQWWEVWAEHWHNRGRCSSCNVMSRLWDQGAYEYGNVYISTMRKNRRSTAVGSVEKRGNVYRAKLRGKSLGHFPTKADAWKRVRAVVWGGSVPTWD